jgi:ectoine hydroxylase-related dioxygenase (phytanoyl-CoA dioxygenase family)
MLAFAMHDIFRRICALTIGSDIDLFFDSILHKPARGGKELRWHQDAAYGRTDPPYIACWVPLSAGSAASGGLWVAPGSHRSGTLEHTRGSATAQEYAGPVSTTIPSGSRPLDLSPGQVAVIHSELLHRSGPNATDTDRLVYQCGFVAASTRFFDDGLSEDHKLPIFRSLPEGAEN